MDWQTRRFLVTVKAIPNPSAKYGETMCVGGIDLDSGMWTRLYPVPFRDLDQGRRFSKYAVIEASVKKAADDSRPESYKINLDSIRLTGQLGTGSRWARRKAVVLPSLTTSFCEVVRQQQARDLSMAAFRPTGVEFSWEKASVRNADRREACYAQLSFVNPTRQALDPVPYNFRYEFKCLAEQTCPGHSLPIIDWELAAAWFHWRVKYPDHEVRLGHIRNNWLTKMCAPDKDTVFFVGNTKRFRGVFMVGGVFYPPR